MRLTVTTPEREFLTSVEVREVVVPGVKGQLGILEGHAPLVTTLGSGVLKYQRTADPKPSEMAISWGFMEVRADQEVLILAESVQTREQLQKDELQRDLKKLHSRLQDRGLSPEEQRKLKQQMEEKTSSLKLFE